MAKISALFFRSIVYTLVILLCVSCNKQAGTNESAATTKPKQSDSTAQTPEPNTVDNYITLSLKYHTEGDFERSIEACGKALNLDPGSVIAYNNICAAHIQLQNYDQAIAACESAIALDPNFDRAKNNLNIALTGKSGATP